MSMNWFGKSQQLVPNVRCLIDGRLQDGNGPLIEKYAPRDGRLLYSLCSADQEQVDAAVASARRTVDDGRWRNLPPQTRKSILHRLANLIDEFRDELALGECLDVGKPISEATGWDVPTAASIVRFNAEALDKCSGRLYSADSRNLSYQLRRPVGVVAGIVGWNFPLVLAAIKAAPVLATGNSLVLKPSELTSLGAVRLAELALQAGVPEGVFNVVPGDPAVGASLALHSGVDLLTFTGSTATGKRLLIAAGQSNMKRLILECGGKAPNIVFEDAPRLDAVAEAVLARAFWNQGQVCTASSRLLVHESVKKELLQLLTGRAAKLRFGDPLRVETSFGAVVSASHKRKLEEYIRSGESCGATLIYRSTDRAPHENGYYVSPAIFDNVPAEARIAREEIFGPVLSVMTFRHEADAIRLANGTTYGLSAILWTKDLARAHRMSQAIQAGWISVNATDKPEGGPGEGELPVAGQKESGLGAEGGIEGLESYMTATSVQLFV